MALYAIGDFHLSLSGSKPMDVFGDIWKEHAEKLDREEHTSELQSRI